MDRLVRSFRHFVGYHRIYLSIAVGILLYLWAEPTLWSILGGMSVVLLGEAIRIWSSGYLTKNKALAQDGPYGLIRHPLYFGNFLIGLGFAIMGGRPGLLIFYLSAFGMIYYSTIYEEEESLRQRFGREYSQYSSRVPLFIPRVSLATSSRTRFRWQQVKHHKEYKTWLAIGALMVLMIFKSYYVS